MAKDFRFYGLKRNPFDSVIPSHIYLSSSHRKGLESLHYALETRVGLHLLLGNAGLGKTALLHHFARRASASHKTAFLSLSETIPGGTASCIVFNGSNKRKLASSVSFREAFETLSALTDAPASNSVLLIDRAETLDEAALRSVLSLAQSEAYKRKELYLIMAGRPGLKQRMVQHPEFALREAWIGPLSAEETAAYIQHRLRLEEFSRGDLFTSDAYSIIHERSGGVPDNINTICATALSAGAERGLVQIDASVVSHLQGEKPIFQRVMGAPTAAQRPSIKWLVTALLALSVASLLYLIKDKAPQASTSNRTHAEPKPTSTSDSPGPLEEPARASEARPEPARSPNVALATVSPYPRNLSVNSTIQPAPATRGEGLTKSADSDQKPPKQPADFVPALVQPMNGQHGSVDHAIAGDEFMRTGNYDQAIISYEAALVQSPDDREIERKLERAWRAQAAEAEVFHR